MKIVVNRCYGGFGLSHKATLRYIELMGLTAYWVVDKITLKGLSRDDPLLVQVVEELGEAANGTFAKLEVVEVPDGIEWEIDEHYGWEHVAQKHLTW